MHLHKDIHSYIYGIHICMEDFYFICVCTYTYTYIGVHIIIYVHIIIEYIYLTYNKIITPASNFLSLSFFPHLLPSYPWFSAPSPSYILFLFFLLSLIFLLLSFFTLLFPPSLLSSLTSSYSLPFLLPPLFPVPIFTGWETNFLYLPYNKKYTHDWGTYEIICYSPNNNIYTLTVCLYLWGEFLRCMWDNNS